MPQLIFAYQAEEMVVVGVEVMVGVEVVVVAVVVAAEVLVAEVEEMDVPSSILK